MLCETVYQFYGEQKKKHFSVIADKNNYYIYHLDQLKSIWPDAKYILLTRDGRDVACSYKNIGTLHTESPYKPKLPTDIRSIATEWTSNNENVLRFFQKLGKGVSLNTRYEDILLDSQNELTRVCNFLGESYNHEMLNFYISNGKNEDEPVSTLDWKRKTLEKPDTANIGKYKTELRKNDIEEFNAIAGKVLNQFHYDI